MNQDPARQLVAEAKKIARQADSWIALSNALCDPHGGLIARYFPDPTQREKFLGSPEYEHSTICCAGPWREPASLPASLALRVRRSADRTPLMSFRDTA